MGPALPHRQRAASPIMSLVAAQRPIRAGEIEGGSTRTASMSASFPGLLAVEHDSGLRQA